MNDVLVYDIETNSLDIDKAKVKWFGAYSFLYNKFFIIPFNKEKIQKILSKHRVFVGFNNKGFDNPILENNGCGIGNYKIIIDLFEMSAPKGNSDYNKYFKNKLKQMGVDINKFSLKNIIEVLKLDKTNKGDIDYKIFQKNKLSEKEILDIKKYLKQDVVLTKKLFEWYEEQFKPLKELLNFKDQKNYKHLTSSLSSLAYMIMCNKSGLELEWGEREEGVARKSFAGGHHIEPRWKKIKGNIVNIDFTSAYPHALMMGNLYSPEKEGWNGKPYFNIEGTYNKTEMGKIEKSLQEMFMLRLKAKKSKDKIKSQAYKICINSLYGLTGNPIFKTFYNPTTASDCTHIVRTWLKKIAKKLEEDGFKILYGFTDNLIVEIPNNLTEEYLMDVVRTFIEEVKSNMPFPLETFNMELDTRMKFIWFVAKNCYLWVTDKDEVKYKSTLLNKNTPKVIMQVFNEYMKPKIIEKLDVNFSKKELLEQIITILEKDISFSGEEYKVGDLTSYKVKTSLQYQISEKYGKGSHFLIPNTAMVGIGKSKGTKKNKPIRYCTVKEYNNNKLKIKDIELKRVLQHIKPFIKNKQMTLF